MKQPQQICINKSSTNMKDLESNSVISCITSPPYLNNFDYAEMTRMHLYIWLTDKRCPEKLKTLVRRTFSTLLRRIDKGVNLKFKTIAALFILLLRGHGRVRIMMARKTDRTNQLPSLEQRSLDPFPSNPKIAALLP
jgi:hypothetical protein